MESYKPNFESLESVRKQINNEIGYFKDANDYFVSFGNVLKNNEDFQKNFEQLHLMSKAFVDDSGVANERSIKSFITGGLFGYNSLSKFDIDNLYDEVYSAISSFHANARMNVNKQLEDEGSDPNESFRNFLISLELNKTLSEDLSFESVDEEEMNLVYKILYDITRDETKTNFAFRGYTFVRGILIWKERHNVEIIKNYLRSINESDEKSDRNFFEIMSNIDIDPDLVDGKTDCEKELFILNTYFKKLKNQYKPKNSMDDDELDAVIQEMEADLMRLIYTFDDLTLFSRFTFEGPNIALIADDRTEFTRFRTFGIDSVLEGNIVDIEVRAIPNQNSLDRILDAQENGNDNGLRVRINQFGLVVQIQDAIIIDDDGSVTEFPKHSSVFVPVGFKNNRILRHIFDENEDNLSDNSGDLDYESDED